MQNTTTAADQVFGYEVIDGSGSKLGSVDNVWVDDATNELEFVGVKTGWLFGKTHVIPTRDAQIDTSSRTISVPYGEEQLKGAPSFGGEDELSPENESEIYNHFGLNRSTAPSPTGLAGDDGEREMTGFESNNLGTMSGEFSGGNVDVPLSEEELTVGKRSVESGQVRLRKVVRTEHREVPVELRREEIQIERVPASEATSTSIPDTAFQEQELTVPVMREEPVVEKQAHVTGQVQVNKGVQTEQRTVGGDVRREDVDVDRGDSSSSVEINPGTTRKNL